MVCFSSRLELKDGLHRTSRPTDQQPRTWPGHLVFIVGVVVISQALLHLRPWWLAAITIAFALAAIRRWRKVPFFRMKEQRHYDV